MLVVVCFAVRPSTMFSAIILTRFNLTNFLIVYSENLVTVQYNESYTSRQASM